MHSIISLPNDYVVVDLETTGLDYEYDSIIELSAIRYRNGQEVAQYNQLVDPGFGIPQFITDLTGISNEMLSGCPRIEDLIGDFAAFLAGDPILGHNIIFDMHFLAVAYDQYLSRNIDNPCIDTVRIARKVLPQLKHHRLCDLAEFYGISYAGAHRASVDCEITNSCYRIMRDSILSSSAEDAFKALWAKKYLGDAKKIHATTDDFDPDHPLYEKTVCFTGALSQMTRAEAMQIVVNCGGLCSNSVTKSTNFLVVGTSDYISAVDGKKTQKMLRVEQLRSKGLDIACISERTFFDYIGIK